MAMPATLPPPSPCKERVFYEPKEYSPGLQLYWASFARSLPDMAEALAHGAEVNWVNTEDDKRTPLMMAVQGVSTDISVNVKENHQKLIFSGHSFHSLMWYFTFLCNSRVLWSPVSFCSRMQPMLTNRTLRAGGRSTTPPCWDTLGVCSTSHLPSEDVDSCRAACLTMIC